MRSINPATGEVLRDYPDHTPAEVTARIQQADLAFAHWRTTTFPHRAKLMHEAAAVLRHRKADLARLMTLEMGKPIASAEAEVEKCALTCDFFADHAANFLATQTVASDGQLSQVRYQPLGVILAVMPWNFPLWQVFRFAAPGLMAGNVGLLKHASNVPGTALAIEEILAEAGFLKGCFTALLIPGKEVESLLDNPIIKAATLTGSEPAGIAIASAAGRNLKKVVLELGGSDPFIVLADAPIPATAKAAADARCINSGQSCIAAKRFIVEESIADAFEREMAAAMQALKVGDPLDRANQVGPLARPDLVDTLEDQVKRSLAAGARLLAGGQRITGKGNFYRPTALANVRPGMAAFDEETFGPVAAITRARDADHAVELANQSTFGLGASLWTSDLARGSELADRIEAGAVFINGAVKSDPRLPFGGIKRSGFGRELSEAGIREFVNIKTVWGKA
jgi:succinate-semialdehyde dehydrogenase/glutarate-semialdehyde dehydrogenase